MDFHMCLKLLHLNVLSPSNDMEDVIGWTHVKSIVINV
jgi:hypothetical protein